MSLPPIMKLPDYPMPKHYRDFLDAFQRKTKGMTSGDAVVRNMCIDCKRTGVFAHTFRTEDHLLWYFNFGMCQACQDNMIEEYLWMLVLIINGEKVI